MRDSHTIKILTLADGLMKHQSENLIDGAPIDFIYVKVVAQEYNATALRLLANRKQIYITDWF